MESFIKIEMTDHRKIPDEPEDLLNRSCRQSPPESETTAAAETPTAPKEPETSERPGRGGTVNSAHSRCDKRRNCRQVRGTEPESGGGIETRTGPRKRRYGRITVRL